MRMQDMDSFCPMCGETLDSFGDHALTCMCGGDRTVRHNCLRNLVWEEATAPGLRAEREKQGLLPKPPDEEGIKGCTGDRRPADVWLPHGPSRKSTALDFAVTCGMRHDSWQHAAQDPNIIFEKYEAFKREFRSTDETCTRQGFTFQPMIIEAHGGSWSPAARRVFDSIAQHQTAAWNEGQESTSLKLAQRLSCSLQRENARALLRRFVDMEPQAAVDAWEVEAEMRWE